MDIFKDVDGVISFSTNWNKKLDCDYFTTIRLSPKYKVGTTWKTKGVGKPFVSQVEARKPLTLSELTDWQAYQDTGYSATKTRDILKTMYPQIKTHTVIYIMLMKRLTPEQPTLFTQP